MCMKKSKRNSGSKASKKSSSDDKSSDSQNSKEGSKRVSNGNSKDKSEKEGKKERKSKGKEEKNKKEVPASANSTNEMELCTVLLEQMINNENCWPFLEPVNTKQFPSYKKIIKKPMDFSTIQAKLISNE